MSTVKFFLKPVVQPILKPLAKVRAKQGLAELRAQGAPACIQISGAIEQAMDGANFTAATGI